MIAYWFSYSDHPHEHDKVGVSELSINGRLLEEFDLLFLRGSRLELLHSYIHGSFGTLPHTFAYNTKLTTAEFYSNSIMRKLDIGQEYNIICMPQKNYCWIVYFTSSLSISLYLFKQSCL